MPQEKAAVGLSPNSSGAAKQTTTFGDWQLQLKVACEADRLEDVKAIVSLRVPKQVILRHVTTTPYGSQSFCDDGSMLFSRGERTTFRDELILFQAMREVGCPPLPDFPATGSSDATGLMRHLLLQPHRYSGSCLFWVQTTEALSLLEQKGASVQGLGWMGVPLLVFMAEKGNQRIVRFLIEERGHDPNVARADGHYTALHWARGIDTVRYLIERGGDANALTSFGDSVLAQQVRSGQADVVDYLLSLGEQQASRLNILHWLEAEPSILDVLCRHNIALDEPIEEIFGEPNAPSAMHRILSTGIDAWQREKKVEGRAVKADKVVECVDTLIIRGWNSLSRDLRGRLPYHIVQEMLPNTEEPLRQALDERLSHYDGPRGVVPQKRPKRIR